MGLPPPPPPTYIHLSDVTDETTWLQTIKEMENYMVNELVQDIRESNAKMIWNVGIGDGSGLLGFMQRMSEMAVCKLTSFDHIIRISVPSITHGCSSSVEKIKNAAMAIANDLKILDEDKTLRKLKNELEEDKYFTYKVNKDEESKFIEKTINKIEKEFASKRCLVIVENIFQPINDPTNKWLFGSGLPMPSKYGTTYWVVSTTSVDVYERSKRETSIFVNHHINNLGDLINICWHPAAIIELELYHVAKSISPNPLQSLTTIMDVLWSCLLYSQLYSRYNEKNLKDESYCCHCVHQKELVSMWVSEGILSRRLKVPHVTRFKKGEGRRMEIAAHSSWVGDEDIGEEILRAPLSHSLQAVHSSLVGDGEEILRALLSHSLLYKCNSRPLCSSSSLMSSSSDASTVIPFSGMWELLSQLTNKIPSKILSQTKK